MLFGVSTRGGMKVDLVVKYPKLEVLHKVVAYENGQI